MLIPVLVATPHHAFGELLRLSLEESGKYRATVVDTGRQALAAAVDPVYRIAILDGDLSDVSFRDLVENLSTNFSNLKVAVIPPDNNADHPILAGLKIYGTINRPFYLPDLLVLMEELSAAPVITPEETRSALPAWLTEKSLRTALSTTTCQAGMLVTRQGEQVFSGIFDAAAVTELTEIVQHYWLGDGKSDLVRFIRLPSTQTDHLLYVTAVMRLTALGLVYPINTPLSRVRQQAGQVARWLTSREADTTLAARQASAPSPAEPQKMPPEWSALASSPIKTQPDTWNIPFQAATPAPLPSSDENEAGSEEIREINLAALLGSVPSPDPTPGGSPSPDSAWVPEISMIFQRSETEPPITWEKPIETSAPTQPLMPPPYSAALTQAPVEDTRVQDTRIGDTRPLKLRDPLAAPPIPADNAIVSLDEEDDETHPDVIASLTSIKQFEPTSTAFSLCNYSCVLVPRLPQHYLTSALSDKLGQWVQQLCLAFGWRLEGIAVRPEYLQWLVQVAPTVAPANMVKVMRQRTSMHIFETFPNYGRENPSGDFWASGYLIVSGTQPPSSKLLRDYIHETRSRQGLVLPITEPPARLRDENTARLQANNQTKRPTMD